jgi:hypothetical protein
VTQVLLRSSRPASSKTRPKTWDGRAVSYTGLVGNAHHTQADGKELLDQIIFFDV